MMIVDKWNGERLLLPYGRVIHREYPHLHSIQGQFKLSICLREKELENSVEGVPSREKDEQIELRK